MRQELKMRIDEKLFSMYSLEGKKGKSRGDENCLKVHNEGNWNPSKENEGKTGKWQEIMRIPGITPNGLILVSNIFKTFITCCYSLNSNRSNLS